MRLWEKHKEIYFREKAREELQLLSSRFPRKKSFYPYQLLAANHIRLLALYPGDPKAPIYCSLKTVNLLEYNDIIAESKIEGLKRYESISSLNPKPKKTLLRQDLSSKGQLIRIGDGHTVRVTINLRDALRRLRDVSKTKILWADALCINQNDRNEREEQVKLMGLIYFKARRVLVWLGPENRRFPHLGAENALTLLQNIARLQDDQAQECPENSLDLTEAESNLVFDNARWPAVKYLLERPWFERVWVAQELGLSRDATFYYGGISFKQEILYSFSEFMQNRAASFAQRNGLNWQMLDLGRAFNKAIFGYFRMELGSDPRMAQTFLKILRRARGLECTDKRDSIYAFLGHPAAFKERLLDHTPYRHYPHNYYHQKQTIVQPDYSPATTYLDVYLTLAVKFIKKFDLGLHLISHVGHSEGSLREDYPSWVPRWDIWFVRYFSQGPGIYYCASGSLPSTTFTFVGKDERIPVLKLQVKARSLGMITNSRVFESAPNHLPRAYINCWEREESESHKLSKATWTPNPVDVAITWTAGLTTGLDLNLHPAEDNLTQHYNRFQAFMRRKKDLLFYAENPSLKHPTELNGANNGSEADYYDMDLRDCAAGRTYFVTEDNRPGLGPWPMRESDEVWIIMGGQMPFVLRPVEDDIYKVVGQAYLHGVMRGEAVEGLTEKDFKRITLC